MIKFKVHTPDGKLDVVAASTWAELTLEQLIELETTWREDPTVLHAFSILTGLRLEITENLTDKGIEKKVYDIVKFLDTSPNWSELKRPKAFFIGDKGHRVPTKIGDMMLGQKIMITQSVQVIEDLIKNIPLCLAVVLQPTVDRNKNKGELHYNRTRVEQLEKQILKSNGLEAYATANFFFQKLANTKNFGESDLTKWKEYQPQTRRQSKNWLKLTG